MSQLSARDRAEVDRSAEEARQISVQLPKRDQVERYLNPPSDTAFPLEYAFSLLGDVRGKTVLDFGCGAGENLVPLVERGARVIGIDISPELTALARQRLAFARLKATIQVGSAYETGLPDASVDVIFCIALIHHLDIEQVRKEMRRILAKDGKIILHEPIRFSPLYARLRSLLPGRGNISDYEHPLTRAEFAAINEPFKADGTRYFRLPLVPLLSWMLGSQKQLWKIDRWCLQHLPATSRYATCVVTRLSR
ncbi:MAG: class I SAM-dependent methyltransferase [Candidatus Sulfotelmatobacter sp.]|jgi:SAM-dependent methyltransferase